MTALLLLAVSLPCVYWVRGIETRATLETAAIKRICVAPERADSWRAAGFTVIPLSEAELASREALPSPGMTPRAGLASPTRSPWIVAAAEAFAYGADAVLKIDPADVRTLGAMLAFLEALPAVDLPTVSDLAIVDDGSAITGEVMNLLARRNLLFQVVEAPSPRFPLNIRIGTPEYPREEAADPSRFALRIRRQLTDDRRALRVYGSEVVICRLTGDALRARLHLINYGGREIEGLRIRLRGIYRGGAAFVSGAGRLPLQDQVVDGGATEFSVPRLTTYAVIDLEALR
jgi:hypothetical protein